MLKIFELLFAFVLGFLFHTIYDSFRESITLPTNTEVIDLIVLDKAAQATENGTVYPAQKSTTQGNCSPPAQRKIITE
jgi:hypothetical protein